MKIFHSLIAIHCYFIAAQRWELVNILPFIIGEDMSPNDAHYECFLLLTCISSMLFSPVIARDQIPLLRLLIKEYLEQFTNLYPHQSLTPKMHYLVHLPTLILRYRSTLLTAHEDKDYNFILTHTGMDLLFMYGRCVLKENISSLRRLLDIPISGMFLNHSLNIISDRWLSISTTIRPLLQQQFL